MPPRLRPSGGGGQGFQLTWEGATVQQKILSAAIQALDEERDEIEQDFRYRLELHRDTGEMLAQSYVIVEVRGTKRNLILGSSAPHTYWHEVNPYNYPPHPVIRETMDAHIPHLTQRIREAVRREFGS